MAHIIKITLRNGSTMEVEAKGRCWKDKDGAGQTIEGVEDLVCYWPRRGKEREIPTHLYDVDEAVNAYWDASERGMPDEDTRRRY